jgi:arsenate reductase
MSSVTIYHNPQCSASRNTLALIREAGIEPEVILYVETPPARVQLVKLIKDSGLSARQIMRDKGDLYDELKLQDPTWSDDDLINFMMDHPILINRPIVVTSKGTRLCRPAELVREILG